MKTNELKRKPAGRSRATSRYSTSTGRANLAEALETAQAHNTVIGFDRYGHPVAALVPIDAVRMLAGHGGEVAPDVREKIARMSRLFLMDMPSSRAVRPPAAPKKAKKKKAPARRPKAPTRRAKTKRSSSKR
ncbi:MAG: hypothetical protein AB7O98_01935 [Hyphomonadaceae bacterium]